MSVGKNESIQINTCSLCGKQFNENPIILHASGHTNICPDCGVRESMKCMGATPEQAERIIHIIHRWKNIRLL